MPSTCFRCGCELRTPPPTGQPYCSVCRAYMELPQVFRGPGLPAPAKNDKPPPST